MNKVLLYMFRWQLSSPILFLVMTCCHLPEWQKVVLANAIGALFFYNIDRWIFSKKDGSA